MTRDTMPQVAKYWNDIAKQFDSIYTGEKSAVGRVLDRWLRQDIFGRFDWVMRKAGNVKDNTVCDIGCGSGRFVTELAKRGARRVLGVDVAPEMLKLFSRILLIARTFLRATKHRRTLKNPSRGAAVAMKGSEGCDLIQA